MQSVRLVYRDTLAGMNINADLNILEATWEVTTRAIQTTSLVVSNADRWPKNSVTTIADSIQEGHVYQALPQLNANSYVTAYTKNVDENEIAAFRFRFGAEVTQLQQVLFEFQLLPFESTVKSVAGVTGTSSSGGGSVQSASSGGSHTHSVTIPSHSHTVTVAAHSHTVTIAAHSHTVTVAAHSHTVTVAAHNHTVVVAAHTHTVSIASHTHTVSISAHSHNIPVYDTPSPGSPSNSAMMFDRSNDIFVISVSGTGNPDYGTTTDGGGSSTPTTASGGSQTPTSSSGGSQTPTSSSGGSQTPTSSTQAQTTPSSSTVAQATPSSSTVAQTTPSSSLASQTVETSSTNGTHTHAVTIPNHTHTLTPVITTAYGIFRADAGDTYGVGELEYQINSGGWNGLDTDSDDAGSGWYALDITSQVQDAVTFRPLQTSNLLEIRAKLTGSLSFFSYNLDGGGFLTITTFVAHGIEAGDIIEIVGQSLTSLGVNLNGEYTVYFVGDPQTFVVQKAGAFETGLGDGTVRRHKTATIDAQLNVRNTIQAITYT
jgi:hypothetical protein